jgi:hypothetical protein
MYIKFRAVDIMGLYEFICSFGPEIFYMTVSNGPKSLDVYLSTEAEFHLEKVVSNKQQEDEYYRRRQQLLQ